MSTVRPPRLGRGLSNTTADAEGWLREEADEDTNLFLNVFLWLLQMIQQHLEGFHKVRRQSYQQSTINVFRINPLLLFLACA